MKPVFLSVSLALILAACAATAYWYGAMPLQVPLHWSIDGQADQFGPRWMLWLIGPGLMLVMLLLAYLLPWLSPRRFEVSAFRPTFEYFIVVLVGMVGYFYALSLAHLLGDGLAMRRAIPLGVFALLVLLGNPMGKVQRNFYIGIRTPWALASNRVWHATHRLAGKLMVASGLLGMLAVAIDAPPALLLVLAGAWALVPMLYSLLLYKRLERTGQLDPS